MTIAKDLFRTGAFALLSVGSLLLVTACGGGGGGGSGSSASINPSTSTPHPSSVLPDTSDIGAGGTGEVTIAWTSNFVNVDGSCSSGIRGYRINAGLSPNYYQYSATVENAQLMCSTVSMDACGPVQRCTYTVKGLSSASWYLSVQSVDVYGNASGFSEAVVATVIN